MLSALYTNRECYPDVQSGASQIENPEMGKKVHLSNKKVRYHKGHLIAIPYLMIFHLVPTCCSIVILQFRNHIDK